MLKKKPNEFCSARKLVKFASLALCKYLLKIPEEMASIWRQYANNCTYIHIIVSEFYIKKIQKGKTNVLTKCFKKWVVIVILQTIQYFNEIYNSNYYIKLVLPYFQCFRSEKTNTLFKYIFLFKKTLRIEIELFVQQMI